MLADGDVLLGMVTPLADLPNTYDVPDTMVSVFGAAGPLTFSDDDAASELPGAGQNRGSLFRLNAPGAGAYRVGVTGYADYEFDGDASGDGHAEAGRYLLTAGIVNPAQLGGGFADSDPANNGPGIANPPNPLPSYLGVPDVISLAGNSARIAVAELLAGDVDFYELHLSAGQVLTAMTAPLAGLDVNFDSPDTRIAPFNSTYAPPNGLVPRPQRLVENDDAGFFGESGLYPDLGSDSPFVPFGIYGSALRAQITETGVYYLGVTGFGDADYTGDHGETGRYALLVGVAVPEPGSFVLALFAMGCLSCGRQKGKGVV